MIVHQVYAMIDEEGTVQNIMVCDNYEDANQIVRAVYGDNAIAVDCLQYPCSPGDKYIDNIFYTYVRDDEGNKTEELKEIEYVPTQEQQVSTLTSENNDLTLMMADVIGSI